MTIGDTVYCDDTALADVQATTKQEWWFSVGSQLAERISVAERARKCGSKLTDADRAGYTISVRECITVLASRPFDMLRMTTALVRYGCVRYERMEHTNYPVRL
eukprot:SAG31_NODE_2298_length_5984_cov_29.550476_3_plen_104_part_00